MSAPRLLLLAIALGAAACASSGRENPPPGGMVDAPDGTADAPPGTVDAPPSTPASPLGMACTGFPGQGTCPTGYECLNLQGASGPWCSKTCTQGTGDTCSQDYTGVGFALCLLSVQAGGAPAVTYCAIVCNDAAGDPMICPAGEDCNGTCPSPLACTQDITGAGMPPPVYGQACR